MGRERGAVGRGVDRGVVRGVEVPVRGRVFGKRYGTATGRTDSVECEHEQLVVPTTVCLPAPREGASAVLEYFNARLRFRAQTFSDDVC